MNHNYDSEADRVLTHVEREGSFHQDEVAFRAEENSSLRMAGLAKTLTKVEARAQEENPDRENIQDSNKEAGRIISAAAASKNEGDLVSLIERQASLNQNIALKVLIQEGLDGSYNDSKNHFFQTADKSSPEMGLDGVAVASTVLNSRSRQNNLVVDPNVLQRENIDATYRLAFKGMSAVDIQKHVKILNKDGTSVQTDLEKQFDAAGSDSNREKERDRQIGLLVDATMQGHGMQYRLSGSRSAILAGAMAEKNGASVEMYNSAVRAGSDKPRTITAVTARERISDEVDDFASRQFKRSSEALESLDHAKYGEGVMRSGATGSFLKFAKENKDQYDFIGPIHQLVTARDSYKKDFLLDDTQLTARYLLYPEAVTTILKPSNVQKLEIPADPLVESTLEQRASTPLEPFLVDQSRENPRPKNIIPEVIESPQNHFAGFGIYGDGERSQIKDIRIYPTEERENGAASQSGVVASKNGEGALGADSVKRASEFSSEEIQVGEQMVKQSPGLRMAFGEGKFKGNTPAIAAEIRQQAHSIQSDMDAREWSDRNSGLAVSKIATPEIRVPVGDAVFGSTDEHEAAVFRAVMTAATLNKANPAALARIESTKDEDGREQFQVVV